MAKLNLTKLRPRLNDRLLIDRAEVRRDVEGDVDDVVDPFTGVITLPAGDMQLVADVACLVTNRQVLGGVSVEAGRPVAVTQYVALFAAGTGLDEGDRITVLESTHDSELVGKSLRVAEVMFGSLEIFERCRCELRERVADLG